jgi:hypothetical protein
MRLLSFDRRSTPPAGLRPARVEKLVRWGESARIRDRAIATPRLKTAFHDLAALYVSDVAL